ncbi:MAG: urease subunit beta [Proteobacteria bacterium]|nr:urease subunit beta [Pseudomonadota bacterium]
MNLTPTELDRLTIFSAAELARRYRAEGIRLSHPEAVALLCDEIMTAARRDLSHPDLVTFGGTILSEDDLLPGVRSMLHLVSVEVSMAEGTKLVTVFDPIAPGKAEAVSEAVTPAEIIPGEIITGDGEIELNAGRDAAAIEVLNVGDRTIQVRSHAHFFEVNRMLRFDREAAFGMHLDVPSGVGARFDPGVPKTVPLVRYGGSGNVQGFGGLTNGLIDDRTVRESALDAARARGYGNSGGE